MSTPEMMAVVTRQIAERNETTVQTPVKSSKIAIAYNPYSIDSLVGCALALHLKEMAGARCVAYNPFSSADVFSGYDSIMFVGVEITKIDFIALMTDSEVKVDLVCYRDSYTWMTDKIRKQFNIRITMRLPEDEMYSKLTAQTDNTAMKVVSFILEKEGEKIPAGFLSQITDLAARYVSQSYPIMPLSFDLGEACSYEEELANKARLHDLTPKLRAAVIAIDPLTELRNIQVKADVSAYLAHFRHVRYALSRTLMLRSFGKGNKSVALPVTPASELTHNDILHAALQLHSEVVTYEDLGDFRVWRIYAKKSYDRAALAVHFNPIMTWSEGATLCVVSHLVNYSM